MDWQDIKVSKENTFFQYKGTQLFNKIFIEVLKFHSPGLAPVKDETGWYHINAFGKELYKERHSRVFGYYCNRASVCDNENGFHIKENGKRAYSDNYNWVGNYQEDLCTVRSKSNHFFHINLDGKKAYEDIYKYAGDFYDGYACVQLTDSTLNTLIKMEQNFIRSLF